MRLLREGQKIHDTYEVERWLGEGAFAEVYRVRHRYLGRQAMKVFRGAGMTEPEITSVLHEAIVLSKLGHPNVVHVFDANVLDTAHGPCGFFTMEFVAGGDLERFWLSHGPRFVPIEATVQVVTQVCRGLSLAHAESPPIVHRDIKPQNILVGYDASGLRVRVSDFGLAKRVHPLSLMASARGTATFKAPETFADPSSDSCAGDVWAIGVMAYLLLTDNLPYEGLTELDLIKGRVFHRPVLPPSKLNVDVDAELERIVLKALAVAPADRYPTAMALLDDLEGWAPPPSGEEPAPAPAPKGPVSPRMSPLDRPRADAMVEEALQLGRQAAVLAEAADLMEEAFNKAPGLRERYASLVRLWRNGVVR